MSDAGLTEVELREKLAALTPPRPAERDEQTTALLDRLDAARRRALGEDHEQLRLA